MRYLGIAVLLLSVLFLCYEYKKKCAQTRAELFDFLDFLKYMRLRISCFMEDKRRLGRGFCAKSELGALFVSEIEKCDGPCGAYRRVRDRLSFSENAKALLDEIFSSCEIGYLDEVLGALDSGISRFFALLEEEEKQVFERCRVNCCILVTLALGIALILC